MKPEKFPGRPEVSLPLPRAQVQSPVEELRSRKSCDEVKKKKVEQKKSQPLGPRAQDPLEGFLIGSGAVCNRKGRGLSR